MGELGALFNPGMRHELEERQAKAARREEEGNAKDGDLRIDLESGVAVINAPGQGGSAGRPGAAGQQDSADEASTAGDAGTAGDTGTQIPASSPARNEPDTEFPAEQTPGSEPATDNAAATTSGPSAGAKGRPAAAKGDPAATVRPRGKRGVSAAR